MSNLEKSMSEFIYSVVTIFTTAGCFGYINYIVLEKLNVLTDRSTFEADKKLKIMFFTGLNIAMYWLLTSTFEQSITNAIILILVFDVVGSVIVLGPLILFVKWLLNRIRRTSKQSSTLSIATRDYLFNTNMIQELYIFGFDNKLITSGYLDYQQGADNNYFDLSLMPLDTPDVDYDYEVVSRAASKHSNSRILVDFEKKIKIFVFRS